MMGPPSSALVAGIAALSALSTLIVLKAKRVKSTLTITLPSWLAAYETSLSKKDFTSDEEMMAVAIEISRRNVAENTGGPFGCAIFERAKGASKAKLFATGCNRVVPLNNSTLHGEVTAIQFAEKKLQSFSLRSNEKDYIMCTSCEPCAMCLGTTLWAAPSEMLCGATKADAEAIGFNEGPVFPESYKQLNASGIKVKRSVLREEGAQVLKDYAKTGTIYNG